MSGFSSYSSLSLEGEGWGEGVLMCESLNPQFTLFPPHPNLLPKGEKGLMTLPLYFPLPIAGEGGARDRRSWEGEGVNV